MRNAKIDVGRIDKGRGSPIKQAAEKDQVSGK